MTRFLFLTILLCSIKVADCQELTSEQLEYDGLTRTYLKYIPAGFDGNNSLPLVMNFHGGTDNGNAQLNIADMRALADQDQFILVYPDAYPEPLEGETNFSSRRWFAYSLSWTTGSFREHCCEQIRGCRVRIPISSKCCRDSLQEF